MPASFTPQGGIIPSRSWTHSTVVWPRLRIPQESAVLGCAMQHVCFLAVCQIKRSVYSLPRDKSGGGFLSLGRQPAEAACPLRVKALGAAGVPSRMREVFGAGETVAERGVWCVVCVCVCLARRGLRLGRLALAHVSLVTHRCSDLQHVELMCLCMQAFGHIQLV